MNINVDRKNNIKGSLNATERRYLEKSAVLCDLASRIAGRTITPAELLEMIPKNGDTESDGPQKTLFEVGTDAESESQK